MQRVFESNRTGHLCWKWVKIGLLLLWHVKLFDLMSLSHP